MDGVQINFFDFGPDPDRFARTVLPLLHQAGLRHPEPLTFLDRPERAYICAMLGVYELTRVEPLRDLYLWAYERVIQWCFAL